jgi:hypothetical protein
MGYRFSLEKYKGMNSLYTCPECNQKKTFTRYVDNETGEHLGEEVGKCSREAKCSHHYTPKQFFADRGTNGTPLIREAWKPPRIEKVLPTSFIPVSHFKGSLRGYEKNGFVTYLHRLLGKEQAERLVKLYFIGSSSYWEGATVFWQVDGMGKIRSGKVMLYNSQTGKRVKEPFNHVHWVHKIVKLPEFNLKQCLFGEHLLKANPGKPVAICESEKTAIIATAYLPQFIWLAAGSVNNLSLERCQVLAGRSVVLFPDLNCFSKWQEKAKAISNVAKVTVSDLLERKASEEERLKGFDLADYLQRLPLPKTEAQPNPLPAVFNLCSTEIAETMGQCNTGPDFDKLIIAGFRLKSGKLCEVLFNVDEEPIGPDQQDKVMKVAAYFLKDFKLATIDQKPCFIHFN